MDANDIRSDLKEDNSVIQAQETADRINIITQNLGDHNCHTLTLLLSGISSVELDYLFDKVDGKSLYSLSGQLEKIFIQYFPKETIFKDPDLLKENILNFSTSKIAYIVDSIGESRNVIHSMIPIPGTSMYLERRDVGSTVKLVTLEEELSSYPLNPNSNREYIFRDLTNNK